MFRTFPTFRSKRPDLAVDLGTANTRIIARNEGIVFDEPTVCSFTGSPSSPRLLAAGRNAYEMTGRLTGDFYIRRPLAQGVLQDVEATAAFLRHALTQVTGIGRRSRPRALIGLPADATKAERHALLVAAADAGFGKVDLVSEPFAAGLGAGLDLHKRSPSMVLECGAGTTEVAVFASGVLCASRSVRCGGKR